jgi:hypothetical protein
MKRLALSLLLVNAGLGLAGCAGGGSPSSLAPAAPFKVAQGMLRGAPQRLALEDFGYPRGLGVIPPYYIANIDVRRLPDTTPVVVAKQWAEDAARGRTNAPLWGATATLVRATATTGAKGGGTRRVLSDRTAWLVLIPFDQEMTTPGSRTFAGTKAVLVDAKTDQYLEGVLLPGSSWR